MDADPQTPTGRPKFDFDAYPADTLFFDRRSGLDRRSAPPVAPAPAPPTEARSKKDRRRRVDPTTFEKQYSADELEFMNAMQEFKNRSGRPFPTHGETLRVARALGYAKPARVACEPAADSEEDASTN